MVQKADQQLAVRLYINCKDLPPKAVFQYLQSKRDKINPRLLETLVWDELPGKLGSVIYTVRKDSPLDDEARWSIYREWMAATIKDMAAAFGPLIKSLQPQDLPTMQPVTIQSEEDETSPSGHPE